MGSEQGKRPDCVVLVAHGVGNQQRWEILQEFQAGLLAFLNQRLKGQAELCCRPAPTVAHLDKGYDFTIKPLAGQPGPGGEGPKSLRLREFHWADLDGALAPDLMSALSMPAWLLKKLAKARLCHLFPKKIGFFRHALLLARVMGIFGLLLLASLVCLGMQLINAPFRGRYNFLAKWVGLITEYLGDILQLEKRPVRMAINQRLHRTISEIIALDRPRFLVLVSHSLGNVFMLDQLTGQLKNTPLPLGWISVGSPLWVLPLIDRKYDGLQNNDLGLSLDLGWHNIFDPMDPLAGPIFNPQLSNKTKQWFRCHFNPVSAHLSYLTYEPHLARLWEVVAKGLVKYRDQPEPRAHCPKNRRILAAGPLLRHGGPDELNVFTAHYQPGLYRATLWQGDRQVASLEEEVRQEDQLTHLWRFRGLNPATAYKVELSWHDREKDCWWRLTRPNRMLEPMAKRPTRFKLATPPDPAKGPWRFLFASCHYPRHVHWDGLAGQGFIRDLLERLDREPHPLSANFLIGDEIYADDWWHEQLYLPWASPEERTRARVGVYGEVYDVFWRQGPWGELLRRAPSYMMWDDHDIRDGWGSNVHDFEDGDFTPAAREKFAAASRAFWLYQAAGNPPAASPRDHQFELTIGPAAFFVFDPRSHRNFERAEAEIAAGGQPFHPFGRDQMERYHEWLERAGRQSRVLVVSTSSPLAFIQGWRLNLAAYGLKRAMRFMEDYFHIDAFDDDWRDQMPNRLNAFARDGIVSGLARELRKHPAGSRRGVLMAGDVHVGHYNRVPLGDGRAIDMWTASPISNKPNWSMRWAACLARDKRPVGSLGGEKLFARDFWSKAARNVVILTMEESGRDEVAPRVKGEIIWESGHELASMSRVL